MNNIGSFIGRLTSRKFLLTVGSVCILLAAERYAEAVAVIIAFIGAEGAADAVSRYSDSKAEAVVARDKILLSTGDDFDEDIDTNLPPINGREASLPSPVSTGGSAPL